MYALFKDPIKDRKAIDHSGFAAFVELGNGYVALKTYDGKFVSQIPNEYGRFENKAMDTPGPYETFGGGVGVGIKTAWTRPNDGDEILNYFCCQLPNS